MVLLDELPPEILIHIATFCTAEDLCRVSQVSKHFYAISNEDKNWKDLFAKNFFVTPALKKMEPMVWRQVYENTVVKKKSWKEAASKTILSGQGGLWHFETDHARKWILSFSTRAEVVLWDNIQGNVGLTIPGVFHSYLGYGSHYNEDLQLVGRAIENRTEFWKLTTKGDQITAKLHHTLPANTPCSCVTFEDRKLITSIPFEIFYRNLETMQVLGTHDSDHSVSSAEFDGNMLYCAMDGGDILGFDLRLPMNKPVLQAEPHTQIWSLRIVENKIFTAGGDQRIGVSDKRNFQSISFLSGHRALIGDLDFDESILVSASNDRSVRFWDLRNGTHLLTRMGVVPKWPWCVRFLGNQLFCGDATGNLSVLSWDSAKRD